jgi:hypothetical protein
MSNLRSQTLLDIRPEIPTADVSDKMNPEEYFQNKTLRPVIKLQHPLLLAAFRENLKRRKDVFFNLPMTMQPKYVDEVFSGDIRFKTQITGIITGLFTLEEYVFYAENTSAINKRIINIIQKRILDSLHEITEEQA